MVGIVPMESAEFRHVFLGYGRARWQARHFLLTVTPQPLLEQLTRPKLDAAVVNPFKTM